MSSISDSLTAQQTWRTRWALWRNGILGSRKFQEWAARTPIFRSVARRKAAGQFDLIAGFVYTQITYVFVQTGLVQFLRDQPRVTTEIERFLDLSAHAAERILKAGVALKLAESPQDDLWVLGEVGAALSVNDGAMAMIRHHQLLYRDMADPLSLLREERRGESELSAFWTYASPAGAAGQNAAPYSELMRATQPMVWQQILGRYPFEQHKKMLDIGGGSGAFVEAVAGQTDTLELAVFDLPDVVPLAAERFASSPLDTRIATHMGSFREHPIPAGYDLITLIRILHDHDDDVAQALLAKIYELLPARGNLLIVEPMAETRGAEAMGDAYFGMYLWAMGSGRPRSLHENSDMLKNVGFSDVKEIVTPLPIITRAIVAAK
ncbi:methyltransferase [Erythrobacter sp. W53]|uniref:methyltransferase n=1 Tax=Erythrobacter sp. W53 TaxID=3425947 RepID=UPI003D769EC4